MSRAVAAAPHQARPDALARACAGLALVLAVALRLILPLDPNIGWLTSVARAVWTGAALGRDIVETNPPMAVWLQTPAVAIEAATGWPAETVQVWLVFALGFAVAEHLVRRLAALDAANRFDRAIAYAVLLAAPLSAFAEREHVGLLLIVPILALTLRRAAGWSAPAGEIVIAGLAAGLAAMVKPHFALPTLALALVLALRRRSPWPLVLPEFVLAALATLAYAGAVLVFLPHYVGDVLPLVLDIYRPVKLGPAALLTGVEAVGWIVALAAFAGFVGRDIGAATVAPFVAAAIGFFVAFVEQGRFWPYHAFPGLALLALAVLRAAPPALTGTVPARRLMAVTALLGLAVPLPNLGHVVAANADLIAAIRAAKPRPTLLALTADLAPAHPIVTRAGARWVGTHSSRWITVYAELRKRLTTDAAIRARCDQWAAFDRAAANRDLERRRPDIVLIGAGRRDWHAWIAADPETARLMAAYRPLWRPAASARADDAAEAVEAWIRADLITAALTPPPKKKGNAHER